MFQAGQCGGGRACTITSTGAGVNQTVFGSCRAASGNVPHAGSCADPLDFGYNWSTCQEGALCLPGAGTDWTTAECIALCDPRTGVPVCPAATSCGAFSPPFDTFGVCQ
jgi:hypothetical protein